VIKLKIMKNDYFKKNPKSMNFKKKNKNLSKHTMITLITKNNKDRIKSINNLKKTSKILK